MEIQWPLKFEVEAQWERCRASTLTLPHSVVKTPIFMPVGTQGTVKGLTPQDLREIDCNLLLGNTYHLGHRPGGDVMEQLGGLHKFMSWDRSILTDSGGFQMVSLLKLAQITEEGVRFQSPHDGTTMVLTPEHSMKLQNQIGADIMMALDDVVSSTVTGPRVEEAMHRTIRWIDRCIAAHSRKTEQNLFGIVQGGLDPKLRTACLDAMKLRDLPGYAIGGLSGGEEKDKFWRVVEQCTSPDGGLPANKPRYVMGVGYAVDMVVCSILGADMFDCVYPSRTARFGTALVPEGTLNLRSTAFERDFRPLDDNCTCPTCKNYTRAFFHQTAGKESSTSQLLTVHNIAHLLGVMGHLRESVIDGSVPSFVREFIKQQYSGKRQVPNWVKSALLAGKIEI